MAAVQARSSDDVRLYAVICGRTLVEGSKGGARAAAMTAERAASEAAAAVPVACPAAMPAAARVVAVDANMVAAAVAFCSRQYPLNTFRRFKSDEPFVCALFCMQLPGVQTQNGVKWLADGAHVLCSHFDLSKPGCILRNDVCSCCGSVEHQRRQGRPASS